MEPVRAGNRRLRRLVAELRYPSLHSGPSSARRPARATFGKRGREALPTASTTAMYEHPTNARKERT
jgi:hypothetical protein